MANREDLDADDDFSEIYKAYTGPLGSSAPNAQDKTITTTTTTTTTATMKKRSHAGSDGEEEARDPNAVPTDFTSREAKVWEAKSKATERNWKKRKEEEMICKICGESGHFTQGCPSTLGANRKSQDFFERVPARDPHVKALFSEDVVNKIEKDIGCKIKIEEKFIIVSGKDRLILKKGVDAVHKVKQEGESKGAHKFPEEVEHKGSPSSPISRSRSLERRSPVTSRLGRSDSQKSNPSPRSAAHVPRRYGRHEKVVEDRVREDLQRLSSGSPQAREHSKSRLPQDGFAKRIYDCVSDKAATLSRDLEQKYLTQSSFGEAYGNDGGRGRSSRSKSPARPSYTGNSYNSYNHSQSRSGFRTDGWNADRGGSSLQLEHKFDYPSVPQTLEDIELQYNREAAELARIRNKEEDEENIKHREVVKEIRESYMKKVAMLKSTHATLWEEFLQQERQKRQKMHSHISASGFSGYKQSGYPEFDNNSGNLHPSGPNIHSRGGYPSGMDSYSSSRPHSNYDDFQRHRHDDYGKSYNRY